MYLAILPTHPAEFIGLQPAAGDDVAGMYLGFEGYNAGLANAEHGLRIPRSERGDFAAGDDFAAMFPYLPGVSLGNLHIVNNAGVWRVDGFDTSRVRLQLAQSLRSDELQSLHAILYAALVEVLEPGQFAFV